MIVRFITRLSFCHAENQDPPPASDSRWSTQISKRSMVRNAGKPRAAADFAPAWCLVLRIAISRRVAGPPRYWHQLEPDSGLRAPWEQVLRSKPRFPAPRKGRGESCPWSPAWPSPETGADDAGSGGIL